MPSDLLDRHATDEELHDRHVEALREVLKALEDPWTDDLNVSHAWLFASRDAFTNMLDNITADEARFRTLTQPQLDWLKKVADAIGVTIFRVEAKDVPKGRPVQLLIDKMPKPTRPPGR
jgi:hypothetical protein